MPDFHSQLASAVTSFIAEVTALARKAAMETLGSALDGPVAAPATRRAAGGSPTPAAAPVPATSRRALPKGAKRPAGQLAGLRVTLVEFVKANPGQRVEQINKALGVSTKDLALPIRKLVAGGELRTEGAKRATKYFPAKGKKS
jgi:hypothetical protein